MLLVFNVLILINGYAQKKYALLIGIDHWMQFDTTRSDKSLYARNYIPDLNGCLNDVKVMTQILKSRFHFNDSDIYTLQNELATRDRILDEIDSIYNKCHKDDVFFLFFSGHGSQVKNYLSQELDKMDETICPYDAVLKYKDIRDKHIALILQNFIDKGIIVTAIFETCHSGSIARGSDHFAKLVSTSSDITYDDKIYPQPGKNGALIISAAQEFQTAKCKMYENNQYQSVFTRAFMDVLKNTSSNVNVEHLFNMIIANLRSKGETQIPTIDANKERIKKSLFGLRNEDTISSIVLVKVLSNKNLLLQGGLAIGIDSNTTLINKDSTIKIQILGAPNLTSSIGKVVYNKHNEIITSGMLFKVLSFGTQIDKKLNIFISSSRYSDSELFVLSRNIKYVLNNKNIKISNRDAVNPYYTLYYENDIWYLQEKGIQKINLGENLNIKILDTFLLNAKTIKIYWPMSSLLSNKLIRSLSDNYKTIDLTNYSTCEYLISGDIYNDVINYSFIRKKFDTTFYNIYPNLGCLYNFESTNKDRLIMQFMDEIWKLSRLKLFVTLENTIEVKGYSYKLVIRNIKKMSTPISDNILREGEKYSMTLVRSAKDIRRDKRWIYIYDISSDGSINLLYPVTAQNIDNHLSDVSRDTIELVSEMTISPPFGNDNIFMISSEEQIINPLALTQRGFSNVTSYFNNDGINNNQDNLTRSVDNVKFNKSKWGIQKLTFKCVPKEGK